MEGVIPINNLPSVVSIAKPNAALRCKMMKITQRNVKACATIQIFHKILSVMTERKKKLRRRHPLPGALLKPTKLVPRRCFVNT